MPDTTMRPPGASALPSGEDSRVQRRAFNLSRWFAAVGLISIATLSVAAALLLSRFLTDRMLHQEGVLTMEFVQSVVLVEKSGSYFRGPSPADGAGVARAFEHVARMPDVIRANVYTRERMILWSSDTSIVGRQFRDNPELAEALAGQLVIHGGTIASNAQAKSEHAHLATGVDYFVEIYFPIWDDARREVVGVVELYKTPHALFDAIRSGERLVWLGAVLGGLFLYVALFWMVRRADDLIREQQDRLVEAETLAAVGEMGSAVAHGIRNPLAAIRSSAELALDGEAGPFREPAQDIVHEVDRLESWVRDLLSYARPVAGRSEAVAVDSLLRDSLGHFQREMEKRSIELSAELPAGLPPVRADAMLIGQVFNSLIANAMEAVQQDGRVRVAAAADAGGGLRIRFEDDGPGMDRTQLRRIFKPFYTTKPKGLGVGLPLARRIVERFGGRIEVASAPGAGTRVELTFPAA